MGATRRTNQTYMNEDTELQAFIANHQRSPGPVYNVSHSYKEIEPHPYNVIIGKSGVTKDRFARNIQNSPGPIYSPNMKADSNYVRSPCAVIGASSLGMNKGSTDSTTGNSNNNAKTKKTITTQKASDGGGTLYSLPPIELYSRRQPQVTISKSPRIFFTANTNPSPDTYDLSKLSTNKPTSVKGTFSYAKDRSRWMYV